MTIEQVFVILSLRTMFIEQVFVLRTNCYPDRQ